MALINLFMVFMKIGALGFGGGYAMIPFLEAEAAAHGRVLLENYIKVIAMAQVVPGPFAVDSSAYIGFEAAGIPGALAATFAICLPSFAASVIISKFYAQFKTNTGIKALLDGVKPAVLGLLASAAYIIGVKPLYELSHSLASLTVLKAFLAIACGYFALTQKRVRIGTLAFLTVFALVGILFF
ncbi:Chromate transporter [Acididesulfobacillus acetoxydans]|uniref:Chromate transport protein ChrA n=1 Tax=Acididesulfobacillus acetoxydans TaxID=1561005 RepID=A0A8S0X5V8_9FIRM|nr:chromate transporter [Acididesulfobacillus acetoxydans]CAA7601970.1 Chromate transporter [Acididesulfobacillus acetoxydans]CEJ08186.1 Chromate transport protein ChrA [Acididesulfobacillus acetoxydans]